MKAKDETFLSYQHQKKPVPAFPPDSLPQLDFFADAIHIRIMRLPIMQIDEKVIISLAKKYGITEVSLFGSALREDFDAESDLDLLVVFGEGTSYSLFDLFSIKEDFSRNLGREVDLIEKDGLRNPYRRKAISGSAHLIYAAAR